MRVSFSITLPYARQRDRSARVHQTFCSSTRENPHPGLTPALVRVRSHLLWWLLVEQRFGGMGHVVRHFQKDQDATNHVLNGDQRAMQQLRGGSPVKQVIPRSRVFQAHRSGHHIGDRFRFKLDLPQVEFEAESVAYVVARAMGLEHPGARDYLLHWRATPELLHRSLVTIQHMVRRILILLEVTYDVPHTTEALLD